MNTTINIDPPVIGSSQHNHTPAYDGHQSTSALYATHKTTPDSAGQTDKGKTVAHNYEPMHALNNNSVPFNDHKDLLEADNTVSIASRQPYGLSDNYKTAYPGFATLLGYTVTHPGMASANTNAFSCSDRGSTSLTYDGRQSTASIHKTMPGIAYSQKHPPDAYIPVNNNNPLRAYAQEPSAFTPINNPRFLSCDLPQFKNPADNGNPFFWLRQIEEALIHHRVRYKS